MTDTRIMPCEMCGGDGVLTYRDDAGCWCPGGEEECPACLGAGEVAIEMEPVEESDVSTLPSISSSSDGER